MVIFISNPKFADRKELSWAHPVILRG